MSPTYVQASWSHSSKPMSRKMIGWVAPLPDAQTVLGLIGGWIEDYNDHHPHSGLKMHSPREFIAAQNATA